MNQLISVINYFALTLLLIGLISILKEKFKIRDVTFLIGTSLLTVGAFLLWFQIPTFEVFAFVLLFALQVIANILQITSKKQKINTVILLMLSITLCILFFLGGLFADTLFFLIAIGTILAGFGYKEPPTHVVRQSLLFASAAIFESLFAYFTHQPFYIFLNILFIFFAILIIRKGEHGRSG